MLQSGTHIHIEQGGDTLATSKEHVATIVGTPAGCRLATQLLSARVKVAGRRRPVHARSLAGKRIPERTGWLVGQPQSIVI